MNSNTQKNIAAALKGLFSMQAQANIWHSQEMQLVHGRIRILEGAVRSLVHVVEEAQPVADPILAEIQEILQNLKKSDRDIKRVHASKAHEAEYLEAVIQSLEPSGDGNAADESSTDEG
jgi:hypothetical protein